MKEFLKYTLATVTGIILTSVILFFVMIITLFGMVSASDTEVVVKKNSVMMLDLNGVIEERAETNPIMELFGQQDPVLGLDDILSSIRKAKENDNIHGIYLQASGLASSYASIQEIRNALIDFKTSGKFIIAYGDYYTQKLYYLSSVADKVMLNPQGKLEWSGLVSQPMFYKNLLDKVGIEMQVFKVGTYKSAVEPYIQTQMSDANREQITSYLGSIWSEMVNAVSESRNITAEQLNSYADQMILFSKPEEILSYGMVDTLIYKNDVRNYIKSHMNIDEDDPLRVLGLNDMINVKRNVPKDKSGNIVAVYYAYGGIDMGSRTEAEITSNDVIRDLKKLKDNDNIKAVVLRVNSPGGSAFGSEQIWHAVKELKAKKPVIVSMGDYAASGGYYISCIADTIVAEPTTLTGSIGIFGMIPNVKGLYDKIGLDFEAVKTNTYSDFGNITRPFNAGEKALMQNMINEGYDLFLSRCAEGRGMTKEEIHKVAEGRVWDGATALQLGLVDELGGINRALEIAVNKAGIENYTVMSYPEKVDFWAALLDTKPASYIEAKMLKKNLGHFYSQYEMLINMENMPVIQAMMEFDPNIN